MDRIAMLKKLDAEEFDLLVIGGGITGAGIAREAGLRGLKVALVERADFAYGTSSRSTKLIHGGLRYLANFEFRLVRESVIERQRLLKMTPQLAKATPFLFPVFAGDPDSLFKLNIGLTLYDWFAGRENPIPHKIEKPREVLTLEPGLKADGLLGGALYVDSRTDDARLTLAVIKSAVDHGAVVANYTRVEGFLRGPGGRVAGATAIDLESGASMRIRAGRTIAAAGPWADAVRRLDDPAAAPLLRLTKGVHITLPGARLPVTHAVVLRGPDARMMFAVPSRGCTYVGTTDTDYDGDPEAVRPDRSDVEYILAAIARSFPEARVGEDDVISAWAGLRPLLRPMGLKDPSATSRDYKLFLSPSGLVTVAGGKLTAFRAMGAKIIDRIFPSTRRGDHLRRSVAPLPVVGGGDRLVVGAEEGDMGAQLRLAVAEEMAVRLEDVIWRRTELMLFHPGNGAGELEGLSAEMGALLGWSETRRREEVEACRGRIASMFAWKEEPRG